MRIRVFEVLRHLKGKGTWFQLALDILKNPRVYWRVLRWMSL